MNENNIGWESVWNSMPNLNKVRSMPFRRHNKETIEDRVFDAIGGAGDSSWNDDHRKPPTKSQVKTPKQQTTIKRQLPDKNDELVKSISKVVDSYQKRRRNA